MEYKIYLVLSLAFTGFVVAAPINEEVENYKSRFGILNALESLPYHDYNSVMWLHRMLSERERWEHWTLPDGVDQSEEDFVRGLTAYGSGIFRSEILHHWSYGLEPGLGDQKEEYGYKFHQKIVTPCEAVVERLQNAVAPIKQAQLEGDPIKLDETSQIWLANMDDCQRIIAAPQHWIDLSYKVGDKNYVLP